MLKKTKEVLKKETKEEIRPKLRIRLRAHDHKILDASCRQIAETASRYGVQILGPLPLPTEIRKYTVNRSTFVHKDSRDQFESRVHKRLIDIFEPNQKIIDALTNLNLPTGVDIEIKM
jgi:small subunit ribosomal protein S10